MSAQLKAEAKPNGVVPQQGQRLEATPDEVGRGTDQVEEVHRGEQQQHARDVGPCEVARQGVQEPKAAEPARSSETTAAPVQARLRTETLMMPDVGGRSGLGSAGAVNTAAGSSSGFFTPKAATTARGAVNPPWMGNVESFARNKPSIQYAARGTCLQAAFAGQGKSYTSGTHATAIQAEVQRQLRGMAGQLRDYESRNQQLERELVEVKEHLRREQERRMTGDDYYRAFPNHEVSLPGYMLMAGYLRMPVYLEVGFLFLVRDYLRDLEYFKVNFLHWVKEYIMVPERRGAKTLRYQCPQREETGPGLLRSWFAGRPRSQTPPPRPQREQSESPVLEALARGVQQLQELQAQALSKATMSTGSEVVKPGTMSLMKMPEIKDGAESALTFQDWLEVSSSIMADISEGSGEWWSGVMGQVEEAYEKWLMASPLERLAVEPTDPELWATGKWNRVNARGASMILAAMSDTLKADVVARRSTQSCTKLMFRAYTFYQPGGGAERQDVLKRLQNPLEYVPGESAEHVLQVVRSWPRWMERCKRVHMTPPDASVLARGLTMLTERHINMSTDASFRTSMLRASLRLDARPTVPQVQAYQKHLQAELESIVAAGSLQNTMIPKLKAVEAPLQPKAKDAGGKGGPSTDLCRYFAKACGCKRGERCSYAHTMAGMDKDTRSKKCLKCGAEAHRAKDCPIGKAAPKTPTPTSTTSSRETQPKKPPPSSQENATVSTMATAGTTGSGMTSMSDVIQGTPWTLEALVQAAQQVVQTQGVDPGSESSPEKTRPQMKVLMLRDIRVCSASSITTALVDSGATHGLRTARSTEEWLSSEEISVQLAGHHQLVMRITPGGTLLMPPVKVEGKGPPAAMGQTIVPMGELIKTLGYSMFWTPEECYLQEPSGRRIPLQTESGCPQMCEMEALAIIARLEDRRLEELKNAMLLTKDRVGVAALAMEKTWDAFLLDYVGTGSFESGLRAVRDAPFFRDLPGECLGGMIPTGGLWSGWDILKEVGCFTRAQKRKLLNSKRWVVHLFAGKEGHYEIMKLDQGETTVIEVDVSRSPGLDLLRSELWRMLLWGAKEGKIDAVIGGPPGRTSEHSRRGDRDVRSMTLVARMFWLHAVAQVGRELYGGVHNHNREVAFMIEYPEGMSTEERELLDAEVQRAEDARRDPSGRAGPAGWEETRMYWESVQRPRLERLQGKPTMDARGSFWDTRMWKSYQQREGLRLVSFDQGATGGLSRNRTTLGTNVASLLSLENLRLSEEEEMPETSNGDHVWSPGLVNAVVVALSLWDRDPRCAPRLPRVQAMSAAQWKQHVDSNHEVFRKDCVTCVTSRGTGRQHRKVHHPDCYVLTADVAGPIAPGLDPTSKGTTGRNLKYLLVAKYLVPKSYIEQFSGCQPPEDDGVPLESREDKEPDELFPELFGEDVWRKSEEEVVDLDVEVKHVPDHGDPALLDDLEELDYEPSVSGEEEQEKEEVPDDLPPGNAALQQGDTMAPEMTYLTFAMGLPNNQSSTVKRGLQDVVLYLQMHGFPVYRFHSDKGEFYNHQLRAWLRDQGILGTWSEPGVVAYCGGGSHCGAKGASPWMEELPSCTVWSSRKEGLRQIWATEGFYVGLSSILHRGHLVYVPADGDVKEKFYHTLHVRPNLVDPGRPDAELCVDDRSKPKRRVMGKTKLDEVEMKKLTVGEKELGAVATAEAEQLLQNWDLEKAKNLVIQLAREGFFSNQKFGVFRHGGTVGWMTGLVEYPEVSRMLSRVVTETCPTASFTSILVSCNTPKSIHKDFNNDYQTQNYVIPLTEPTSGGELWVELKEGDVVCGPIDRRDCGGKQLYGQLHSLQPGRCIEFSPARFHEVSDWEGERVVLIAYTPNCLGKLSQEDLHQLHQHGFQTPLSQLPEFNGSLSIEPPIAGMRGLHVESDRQDEGQDGVDHGWSMYLDLEPGLVKVKIADCIGPELRPVLQKAEVGYTEDIETVLKNLSGPLDVVHNVSPDEVMSNFEQWRAAITKEVQGVSVAIERLVPGSPSRKKWLNLPRVQRLPMKFVFTIKPNDGAKPDQPETWFKRKARLVICGNMARFEEASLYAETAPAEAVRMALTMASKNRWLIAILDIVAAFLKTPLGRVETDPVVVAQPLRLLEALGLIEPMELWGLIRALYGLREAPMLWTNYRDATMQTLRAPVGLSWYQGKAITSWWTLRDKEGKINGLIVVYVDDYMLCGPREVICEVSSIIQEMWDTSELTFLGPGSSVRFLGMELHRETEDSEVITVFQKGYVQELLRLHEVKPSQLDRVPITKELSYIPEKPEQASEEDVRKAQQMTGEALWVAQRTRPDLSYTTSMMASLCTRSPSQVVMIGNKVLGYLQRTMNYGLRVQWGSKGLVMFCDAAYAPQGDRSHGGWVVTYGGVPIVWRSGRQQMVTLSTAEAELLSMIDGAVAMLGLESLLVDIGEVVYEREIASDSMAALSISSGSSSWRTRHLRIKANWLQEKLSYGVLKARHCPGEHQPADLLTKALSYARMTSLLSLWSIGEQVLKMASTMARLQSSSRVTVALVCCLLIVSVQATDDGQTPVRGSGLQVDRDLVGSFMVGLMVLGALLLWEGLKWLCQEVYNEYTPGASARKLKKLKKLREATTRAIERELDRLQEEHQEHGQSRREQPSSASSTTRSRRQEPMRQRTPSPPITPRTTTPARMSTARLRTPTPPRPRTPSLARVAGQSLHEASRGRVTTATWSPGSNTGVPMPEFQRVCEDVCRLMTCESLKEALRTEGLAVSGLKDDQARRLGHRMMELADNSSSPTIRQLRYVLWLWRHKDMSGRHVLRYFEINNRERISALIAQWNRT
ncbi:RE1 [Symbiodinium sp. CCMP2592]|nr:RE1 [Symbiodinium sp. CCMP2592]